MKKNYRTCLALAALLTGSTAMAQTEQADLYDLSLEELMNVSIVSASKEKERLFDAPVAVYSVTRDEISKAGILSIPEALRLIPGVVVRETGNGNYDIHLRGFDNTARYTYGQNQINTISLVMINNRPVFNHNAGGTMWESLPIDIADVDRIEVVCGPSAPLFGPNAVSGVVNIITRDFKKEELLVSGQLQGAFPGDAIIGSLAVGRQFGDKFSVGVTGNYQQRNRLDEELYMFSRDNQPGFYLSSDIYRAAEVEKLNLDPSRSLTRKGLNTYISYKPTENITLDYSAGIQAADAQKIMFTTLTPTSHTEANSFYNNLSAKVKDLSLRMSYVKGNDELHKLGEGYSTAYDYHVVDVTADYDVKINNKLKLRPSLFYQASQYSDLNRLEGYPLGGLINGEQSMKNLAASIRADFNPFKGLRLIGSSRLDQFDVNEDLYLSYQFATTYAVNDKFMLRAVHGKSYSGIFYNSAFVNAVIPTGVSEEGTLNLFNAMGNLDVRATANTLSEIGMRANIKNNLQLDLTIFSQKLDNVSLLTYLNSQTYYTERFPNGLRISYHQVDNLNFTVHQQGATASLNWIPNQKWQIRPFITVQKTEARNFDFYNNPQATGVAYNGQDVEHESTPSIFGGWYINYSPISRLNINTSAYYFSDHKMYHQEELNKMEIGDEQVVYETINNEDNISGKMLINARVSYQVYKKLNVFIGGKNLLNQNTREYYGTDRMGAQYFSGIGYNF